MSTDSPRILHARERALARRERQRNRLSTLGWALLIVVAVSTISARPHPGVSGNGAGVSAALAVCLIALGASIDPRAASRPRAVLLSTVAAIGVAGIALAALQPHGQPEIAASAAIWLAITRLSPRAGIVLGSTIAAGLIATLALGGSSVSSILGVSLLCGLLALMAYFMKQAREGEDRTELLLAELEDARDEQAAAAAVAERSRIAGELHDVLAHSLSGAAIQLQAARRLAEREHSPPQLTAAIARASELVTDGLGDARRAVGALRGDGLPGAEQIAALVESFCADTGLEARIAIEGPPRPLRAEAGLALYRGAQEAMTNVARHAPGAAVRLALRYEPGRTVLAIDNGAGPAARGELSDAGGGRGLEGMRDRVERAGGTMSAGPSGDGWRVELVLPQ